MAVARAILSSRRSRSTQIAAICSAWIRHQYLSATAGAVEFTGWAEARPNLRRQIISCKTVFGFQFVRASGRHRATHQLPRLSESAGRAGSMFQRRNAQSLMDRVRSFFWPRTGFARAWKYIAFRLSRINTSPHGIAAGFAAGAAASFTPLLGLHIILGCAIAFITRGSMIAAVLGTLVGNPVTFPFMFSATYWVGARIQVLAATEPAEALEKIVEGLEEAAEAEADAAADAVLDAAEDIIEGAWSFAALDVLWPALSTMLIGALLMVPIAYVLSYFAVRAILHSFGREKRR